MIVSVELLELSQRLDGADQRLARLEGREGLLLPQGVVPIQPDIRAQSGTGVLTVGLLKARLVELEQRVARLEAGQNG